MSSLRGVGEDIGALKNVVSDREYVRFVRRLVSNEKLQERRCTGFIYNN
jgi:hypothetical protein